MTSEDQFIIKGLKTCIQFLKAESHEGEADWEINLRDKIFLILESSIEYLEIRLGGDEK